MSGPENANQPTSDPDDDFRQALAIVGIPVALTALAGAVAIVVAAIKHRDDNRD